MLYNNEQKDLKRQQQSVVQILKDTCTTSVP